MIWEVERNLDPKTKLKRHAAACIDFASVVNLQQMMVHFADQEVAALLIAVIQLCVPILTALLAAV